MERRKASSSRSMGRMTASSSRSASRWVMKRYQDHEALKDRITTKYIPQG